MRFIGENGQEVQFRPIKVLQRKAFTGTVYKLPNQKCLKVYNNDIDVNIQKRIQALNLSHYFKAEEFLYNYHGDFKAITMPYYEEDETSPILKPTPFILENLEAIRQNAEKLGNEGIEIWDLHPQNIIWTKDGAVVIDTDDYKYGLSTQSATYTNDQVTMKLLTFVLIAEAKKMIPELRGLHLYEYFYAEGIPYISKLLESYEYPIDYIRKLTK